ncbi:MAG: phosphoglycerate dehydrogenase [Candidatus Dormibacteraeota bacterium]|nr:phosphoglycerate dehydrogenase [Candidatus Dormibacteraeota bacterium]MBO0745980.1 phosphoglycerate dehydrogenase [Candidatus Dormibacteraeota bacterium]
MAPVITAPPTIRALLLENVDARGVHLLQAAGWEVSTVNRSLSEEDLLERLQGVQILGIRSKTRLTQRVFEHARDLIAVGAFCIGTDQIDLEAASRQGVAVFNAPFSNTRSVVELVLSEIIALYRQLPAKTAHMHRGVWDKSAAGSHEVRGRTLGIVGYGKIGSQLSVLAENLGLRVCFYDIQDRLALGNARQCGSLHELLEDADVVTLHVDGRPGNSGMFGEREFSLMRDGSLFLNLSRGFVVDHSALRRHLESGHLAGASIDVFPTEPLGSGDEFESELRGLDNVILTPHIGGSTEEAQRDIGEFVGSKLRDHVERGTTALSVNFPELVLPGAHSGRRIGHLHSNVPGVLAKVNSILAGENVNVDAQLLGTRGHLGYLITDVDHSCSAGVIERLQELEETIRLRVL